MQKLFDILSEYTFSAFVSLVECGIEDGFFAKKENDYLIFSHYDEDFISYDNLEKLSEEDEISISNYSKCISVYQNGKKIKPKEYTDDMKKTANGLLEDQKEYVLEFY